MRPTQLDVMMAESGLPFEEADHLAALLAPLVDVVEQAPEPSQELLALFGETPGRSRPPRSRSSHRTRGAIAGVVVLALSGVGATALSAAANTLPAPWQHQVSKFSEHYLPFDFPPPPSRRATSHPLLLRARSTPPPTAVPRGEGDPTRGGDRVSSPRVARPTRSHGAPAAHGSGTGSERPHPRTGAEATAGGLPAAHAPAAAKPASAPPSSGGQRPAPAEVERSEERPRHETRGPRGERGPEAEPRRDHTPVVVVRQPRPLPRRAEPMTPDTVRPAADEGHGRDRGVDGQRGAGEDHAQEHDTGPVIYVLSPQVDHAAAEGDGSDIAPGE